MTTHEKRRALGMAHTFLFGASPRKTVPAYDVAMVKRLPAGVAAGSRISAKAGFYSAGHAQIAPRGKARGAHSILTNRQLAGRV